MAAAGGNAGQAAWVFLRRLGGSRALRNVIVVMTGTALAQALGFALSPVISRLFSPADFGVLGSFGAVSGVVAAVVTLEYTQAILLPKERSDAINLFVVSCLCTLAIGGLCAVAALLAPAMLLDLMHGRGSWLLVLLPVSVAVSGINAACQAWCVRAKAFRLTSASQVVRGVASGGSLIGAGCLKTGATGMVVSGVFAELLATLALARVVVPDLKDLRSVIRWERVKALAFEYRDFPLYAASQNMVTTLSQGVPVLLLTHFYGIATAGAYAFGMRILHTPMGLVLRALRQVLLQKACEDRHRGGSLLALYLRVTALLLAIAMPPAVVLMVYAPPVFLWVFGPQWGMAGEFARSLVLWMAIAFCNLPAVLFAQVIRIQRTILIYDLVVLVARVLVLVGGGLWLDAGTTILVFSVVGAAMNLVLIALVGRALMRREGVDGFQRLREYAAGDGPRGGCHEGH